MSRPKRMPLTNAFNSIADLLNWINKIELLQIEPFNSIADLPPLSLEDTRTIAIAFNSIADLHRN